MKKILRFALIGAMVMFSTAAMADTTVVGAEDNSTGYFGAHSQQLVLKNNQKAVFEFKNYSSKQENWHNWVACVSNDADIDGEGYALLLALRADNWDNVRWGNSGIISNYNWDTFREDMDGSSVVLTFTYQNESVVAHADITTANGTTYYEESSVGVLSGDVRVWLTVEGSHLDVSKAEVVDIAPVDPAIKIEGTKVGGLGLNSLFFSDFSDYVTLKKNQILTLKFKNYTDKTTNYNNWLLVVTSDADRPNDIQYIVLRADNYCFGAWGNSFDNSDIYQISNNYNWETFVDDMYGATVVLTVTRDGAKITVHADVTTAVGAEYWEELVVNECEDGEQNIRAYLTIERACLDLLSSSITDNPTPTGISTVNTAKSDAVRYNLAGQQVGAGYKGVVIENGKKLILK